MKLPVHSVTAVIPTRGDVDMRAINSRLLSYPEIGAVWTAASGTPFSRYLLAAAAPTELIYTQDDDCLTDIQMLLDNAKAGHIVNAMTEEHAAQYPGRQTLLGFGALFQKRLVFPLMTWERDELFLRESDRVFGTIHPHVSHFPNIVVLPHAHAPNRFWKQTEHVPARLAIEKRIFERTGLAPR